jgi:hypothetical protein
MPIPLICPCSAKLRVADHLQGQYIKCPRCGAFHAVGTVNGQSGPNGHASAPPAIPPLLAAAPADTEGALAESTLSDAEREQVRDLLEAGEHVLWADKPDADAAQRYAWLLTAVFGVVALILILAMVGAWVSTGGGGGMVAACIILGLVAVVLIGAGLAAPKYQRWRATKAFYAVTDRRALAWVTSFVGKVNLRTYKPASLTRIQSFTRPDGLGSLLFGREFIKGKRGQVRWIRVHGFFYLRNAPMVEKLLRDRLVAPFLDKVHE